MFNKKYILVSIKKLTNEDQTAVRELKIDQKNIRFFRDVLMQQFRFSEVKGGWNLDFFVDSDYQQRLFVEFEEGECSTIKNRTKKFNQLTQLAFVESAEPHLDEFSCEMTSLLIRGSKAIKVKDLYQASTHCGYIDGRGAQYIHLNKNPEIENSFGKSQFFRHVLLHSLAYAYLMVMEQLSNALVQAVSEQKNEDELRQIYKKVVLFNARYFLYQPINLEAPAMCEAWKRVDQVLGISQTNQELIKQIENVHYILNLENDKKLAQEKEKAAADIEHRNHIENKYNQRLALVAIWISFIGLISVVDIIKNWIK